MRINISRLSKKESFYVKSLLLQVRRTRFPAEASHHVNDSEVAVREGDGVGRGGHWQHEGQRGGDGAGEHDVQRVNPDGCGLQESKITHQLTDQSGTTQTGSDWMKQETGDTVLNMFAQCWESSASRYYWPIKALKINIGWNIVAQEAN